MPYVSEWDVKALFNRSIIYIAPLPQGAPWRCRLGCEHDTLRLLLLRSHAGTQSIDQTGVPAGIVSVPIHIDESTSSIKPSPTRTSQHLQRTTKRTITTKYIYSYLNVFQWFTATNQNFRCQINYATQTTSYWSIYTYIKKKKGIRNRRATGSKAEKSSSTHCSSPFVRNNRETTEGKTGSQLVTHCSSTVVWNSRATRSKTEKKLYYAILKHCRLKQSSNGKQDWKPFEYALLDLDQGVQPFFTGGPSVKILDQQFHNQKNNKTQNTSLCYI